MTREKKFKKGDHVKIVYPCDTMGKTGTVTYSDDFGGYNIALDGGGSEGFSFCSSLEYSEIHNSPLWQALK